MEFVFGTLGLFVQFIFLFKREWLINRKSFYTIVLVSAVMFLFSHILVLSGVQNPDQVRFLMLPLFSSGVFYGLNFVFFKMYKRTPEDTFWSMDWAQIKDGIFMHHSGY